MPRVKTLSSADKLKEAQEKADMHLRKAIVSYMVEHNETKELLAERVGISRQTFWRKVDDPGTFTVRELRRLANIIGLDDQEMAKCLM